MDDNDIINKIINMRPEAEPDPAFVEKLRRKIASGPAANKERNKYMNLWEKIVRQPVLVAGSMLAVVLITVAVINRPGRGPQSPNKLVAVSVSKISENAFGSLAALTLTAQSPAVAPESMGMPTSDVAVGRASAGAGAGGGGGMAMAMPQDSKALPLIYPGPEPMNYRFVYKGGDFPLPGSEVEVYRKLKGELAPGNISAILGAAAGFMDFSTFGSTRVQSVNFYEARDGGYQIYVDFQEGLVQVSERFPKIMEMRDFALREMPDKERIIETTSRFLADHGVNLDGYGEPELQEWWYQTMAMGMEDVSSFRIADAGVVYPLLIAGQKALDQSGSPVGLVVNVRLSDMKVTGFWNLSARRFESSAYPAETDRDKILALAERGGINNYYYPMEEEQFGAKTVDVDLGTPQISYIQYWKYDGSESAELYVPAYLFPIQSKADAQIWQKYVIVPLATELIDLAPTYPVPLMEKSSN